MARQPRQGSQPCRYHEQTVSTLRVSPRRFLILCWATLAMVVLNVITGAAVRLSDSGLGCPDWPTCSQHHLTPPLSLHPVIEFANRLVVTLLVVACAVTVVASFLRRPARRDLRWLSAGLIMGILGEAVLGAFVVYSKLNAYVVMTHFMVGMALLAVAVILTLEAGHGPGPGDAGRDQASARWLTRALLGPHRDRAGRRDRHHRGRAPRRRERGQADPHRPRGHDPDPRRDRARPPGCSSWCCSGCCGGPTLRPVSKMPAGSSWR